MITTQEAIKLSKDKPADEKKAEEQAAFAEARLAKLQWLEHPVTKSLIRTLVNLIWMKFRLLLHISMQIGTNKRLIA
jgi:hypothetical protein